VVNPFEVVTHVSHKTLHRVYPGNAEVTGAGDRQVSQCFSEQQSLVRHVDGNWNTRWESLNCIHVRQVSTFINWLSVYLLVLGLFHLSCSCILLPAEHMVCCKSAVKNDRGFRIMVC